MSTDKLRLGSHSLTSLTTANNKTLVSKVSNGLTWSHGWTRLKAMSNTFAIVQAEYFTFPYIKINLLNGVKPVHIRPASYNLFTLNLSIYNAMVTSDII